MSSGGPHTGRRVSLNGGSTGRCVGLIRGRTTWFGLYHREKTIITIIFYQGRMRSFVTPTWAITDKNSPHDATCTVISLKKKKSDWDYIGINALAL